MFNRLKILFKAKYSFKKKKRRNVIIFDHRTSNYLENIIKKNEFDFFFSRHEKFNIPILIKTLINNGFKKFSKNYFLNFIRVTKPKFIITAWVYDIRIYEIKKIFPHIKIIAIQSGNFLQNETFLKNLKLFNKGKIDYFFVFSKNEKKLLSKTLKKTKIIISGSFLNNRYIKKKLIKKKKIIILSEYKVKRLNFNEKKIIYYVNKFCEIKNLKFDIQLRYNKIKELNEYYDFIKNNNFRKLDKIFFRTHKGFSYIKSKYYKLVVGSFSTLLHELFSAGQKIALLDSYNNFNSIDYEKNNMGKEKYKKILYNIKKNSGFFWSNKLNEKNVNRVLNNLFYCSDNKWFIERKKYENNLMFLNPKNTILKNELKSINFPVIK